MREDVTAEDVLVTLHAAVAPFLERARDVLPAIPKTPELHAVALLQLHPLVARLVLQGPATSLEALRLVGPEVPGHTELGEAVERFVAAGLSGLPTEVVDGTMMHASKPGAGLLVTLDLETGAIACLLAPSRVPLARAVPLFSVQGHCATREPSGTLTAH